MYSMHWNSLFLYVLVFLPCLIVNIENMYVVHVNPVLAQPDSFHNDLIYARIPPIIQIIVDRRANYFIIASVLLVNN